MSSFVTPSGGGTGTVTSVGVTAPAAGITSSGGPITTSGAITLALADDLAALEALSSTGYAKRTGTSAWSVGTAVDINTETTGNLSLTRLSTIADQRLLGNVSGGTAAAIALTQAQTLTFLGTIGVSNGGTGQTTFTKGDLLAAPGGVSLNKLGIGSDGQILTADAASTNGIKWAAAAAAGVTQATTLVSGRVTLSNGTNSITDSSGFTYSANQITLGTGSGGGVLGNDKLILKSTANANIELTPGGTGNTDVTQGLLLTSSGSQGAPAIQPGRNANYGIYLTGEPSICITAGGGNALICAASNVRSSFTFQAATSSIDLGTNASPGNGPWRSIYWYTDILGATYASPTATQTFGGNTGSGTDNAGSTLVIRSGLSTGSATPPEIIFKTGTAGSTGTTVQTASERCRVTATGFKIGSSGTTIKQVLSATATLDFGSISAGASADLTITVTGAAVGDSVSLGLPSAPAAGICFNSFVSATDTVTVRAFNVNLVSAVDPASATYRASVFNF